MAAETLSKNIGFLYGLIAGLIMSVITIVQYAGGIDWYIHPLGKIIYVLLIFIAVLAALKQKNLNNGFLDFKDALKTTFTVFVLGLLLHSICTYIIVNYIDISFKEALVQKYAEATEEFMRKVRIPEAQIDKALEESAKSDAFSFKNTFLGWGIMCILYFIVALIISAIVKKTKPPFPNAFN